MTIDQKFPRCDCTPKKFTYYRRLNKNGTLHLMRRCVTCQRNASSAMRGTDYPAEWVNALEIEQPRYTGQTGAIVQNDNPTQSRADAIMHKLQSHIANRGKPKSRLVY